MLFSASLGMDVVKVQYVDVTFFFLSKKKVTKEKSRGLVTPCLSQRGFRVSATRVLHYAAFLGRRSVCQAQKIFK